MKPYEIQARTGTSDGGFIFTGNIDGEFAVVKTTSEGLLTPTCTGGGGECSISATAVNIFCDDQGSPDNPLDDKFGFDLLVTGSNTGSNWSATENSSGQITGGQYDVASTYPELFFIQTGANFLIEDNNDASCSTFISVTPPAPCSNGNSGVDLELDITSNSTFEQYQNVSFEVNLTNAGVDPVADITVYIISVR